MSEHLPIFMTLVFILLPAALVAMLMSWLRQPALIAYLLVGVVLGYVQTHVEGGVLFDFLDRIGFLNADLHGEIPKFLGELGIVLLLFMAGLHIKPKQLLVAGRLAFLLAGNQLLFFSLVGIGVGWSLGLSFSGIIIFSVSLWLSSTIVVLGVLERLGETNEPHGKAMMTIMLFQDIVALIVITLIPVLSGGGEMATLLQEMAVVLLKAIGLMFLTLMTGKYVFPRIMHLVENDREQILIFPLAWMFLHMGLAYAIDFSMESAAFFAGISISTLGYSYVVSDRLRSLMNFGLLFFFVQIGTGIDVNAALLDWQLVVVVLVIVVGTPFINLPSGVFLGLGRRGAFVTGLVPAQISEFSLVVLSLAVSSNLMDESVLSLITTATVLTMMTSSFLGSQAHSLYYYFRDFRFLQWAKRFEEELVRSVDSWDVVIYGADKHFFSVAHKLIRLGLSVVILDIDSGRIMEARKQGLVVIKADYLDPDVVFEFVAKRIMISTMIRSKEADLWTISHIKSKKSEKDILAITVSMHHQELLKEAGWDKIIDPQEEASRRILHEIDLRAKNIFLS